jgi:hypothetical protein
MCVLLRCHSWRFLTHGIVAILAATAMAAFVGNAQAACYGPQQVLSAQTVSAFLSNPAQMLQDPDGGARMIGQIRDLAASDPATLDPIIGLLANANKGQKTAIGSGLAQAARICVRTDQLYAGRIQDAVAQTKDQDVILAYAAITGEQPTAAVGGGAGGGAVGGQTNPLNFAPIGSGAATPIGGPGTPTLPFAVNSSVSGSSGISLTTAPTAGTGSRSP